MFLTALRSQFKTPRTEEERQQIEKIIDSIMVKAPGFQACYGVSVSDTEALLVTLWDNEADWQNEYARGSSAAQNLQGQKAVSSERTSGQVQTYRENGPMGKTPFLASVRFQFPRPEAEGELQVMEKEVYDAVMTKAPGFRALYRTKVSETEILGVTVWDSEADQQKASEQVAAASQQLQQQGLVRQGVGVATTGQVRTYRVKASA
jgi:heme-degrading monooxygenase HmoA